MKNNNFFIIIPKSVYQSDLSSTEKNIYGFIYSMSKQKGYCYAKNEYIQNQLNISKSTLNRALKKLINESFIQKEFKGAIRHLIPLHSNKPTVSDLNPNSIKNDTSYGIKSDTHNNKSINKKENKLMNDFSFNQDNEQKIKTLLIQSLEHLNKRYLRKADFKIKISEQKHIGFLFDVFRKYLGDDLIQNIDSIDNDFYKYLYSFYLDFKDTIHKESKRYYPYRFKGFKAPNFNYQSSKYKNKDYLKFKKELEENDTYNRDSESIINKWFNDFKK